MLTNSDIQKFDSVNMHKIYDEWPKIAKIAVNSKLEKINLTNINHIVFCGMGGSGTIGDILASILSKTNIHVCVTKGYVLPKTVDKNTLIIFTSISGNTDEINHLIRSANLIHSNIIAFTSGGKLEDFCTKNNLSFRKIKMTNSPRASLVNYIYSIINVLEPILPIEKNDIDESIVCMEELQKQISSNNLNLTNPALNLANWIKNTPLIYYPWGLGASAIRFKNSLQENSKSHAFAEDVIEMCHNGIVSWEQSSDMQPIMIEGHNDNIKTKERWEILKDYFKINNIEFREIHSVQGSILSKLINLIYFLDYTSIYLAFLRGMDPSPVSSIDFIKSKLN